MSLIHLAHLAEHRPDLLAGKLAAYQHSHHLDDQALGQRLQCSLEQLARLKLCECPHPDHWHADLEQITTYLHLDAVRLSDLLTDTQDYQR